MHSSDLRNQFHLPNAPAVLVSFLDSSNAKAPHALGLMMLTPTVLTIRLDNVIPQSAPHQHTCIWLECSIEDDQLTLCDHRVDGHFLQNADAMERLNGVSKQPHPLDARHPLWVLVCSHLETFQTQHVDVLTWNTPLGE